MGVGTNQLVNIYIIRSHCRPVCVCVDQDYFSFGSGESKCTVCLTEVVGVVGVVVGWWGEDGSLAVTHKYHQHNGSIGRSRN